MTKEKSRVPEQFTLSKIFHEIKNPLTLINSSLQLIESDHPEVHGFQFWDQTMEDLKSLRLLLDDMSSFQNGERLISSDFSVMEFADELKTSMTPYLTLSGVTLHISCRTGAFVFCGDRGKLRQAVVNLLKNAVEASAAGDEINLHFSLTDSALSIEVADHGCGMSEETLSHLFEPFRTTKKSGTGLGLCISRRIIEAHRGQLTVASLEGQGTVFHILLPLSEADDVS